MSKAYSQLFRPDPWQVTWAEIKCFPCSRHDFGGIKCIQISPICVSCAITKAPAKRGNLPFLIKELVTTPFDIVHIDFYGPIHPPSRGYNLLQVMIDYATGWPEIVPITYKDGPTVATVIFQYIIARFGVPRVIVSDNDSAFLGV